MNTCLCHDSFMNHLSNMNKAEHATVEILDSNGIKIKITHMTKNSAQQKMSSTVSLAVSLSC